MSRSHRVQDLPTAAQRLRAAARRVAGIAPPSVHSGPTYWRWRRFLRRAQWWPAEDIERWQLGRLQHIVHVAYHHTVGYRELFRGAGVQPSDIRSLSDRHHLPVVTKEMLQERLQDFTVPGGRPRYVTTGGSTGIPFGFHLHRRDGVVERAFMHAGWEMAGWRLNTRNAVLRGGFVGSPSNFAHWDAYQRQLLLSSYYLTPDRVRSYLHLAQAFGTTALEAYPSSLNMLCDLVAELDLRDAVPFTLVLLGSENVYDWVLERAAEALPGVRLHAWYGHAEQAVLAPWCESSRTYHVWPFYGIADIVGEQGTTVAWGAQGEIIATSLRLTATPFIRYRTMDMAVRGADHCPECGRRFPVLSQLVGRAHEVIVTSTGRHISMTMINFHDSIFDSLRQFQFRQESPGAVTFQYIPKHPLGSEQVGAIRHGIQAKLGADMDLFLQEVASIPRTGAGKYRFLDQRLTIRYGDRIA